MLPVLYRFTFDTDLSKALLYLFGALLIAYSAWSGWRNADGGVDSKGAPKEPTREDRRQRAISHGLIAAAIVAFGFYYALPQVPFFGPGKGEGIPIHTYGVLVGTGFITAVTAAGWLAQREWPGKLGLERRQQLFDLAFYVFGGAMLGSRDVFVFVNWSDYVASPVKQLEAIVAVADVLVLAWIAATALVGDRLYRDAARRQWAVDNAIMVLLVVAVGGRVVLVTLFSGKGPAGILELVGGGLVFQGGLAAATVVALWYATKHGIQFARLADLALPTVSLGAAFGRLGCFSAGCCWGRIREAGAKLAVEFPGTNVKTLFGGASQTPSLAFGSQRDDPRYVVEATGHVSQELVAGAVKISDWATQHGHTLPVHPTQLYESAAQMLLFVGFLLLRPFRRFHGQLAGIWLMVYSVERSTVELFRGDLERGTIHNTLQEWGLGALAPQDAFYNLSTSQLGSVAIFTAGAVILYRQYRLYRAQPKFEVAGVGAGA